MSKNVNGGIPLSWLIDVTSRGVREAFSLAKLHTLAISKYDDNFPTDKWTKFFDADSVAKSFGFTSKEYKFALNYFGVTNKKSSKADLLTFYKWTENATPPAIRGVRVKDLDVLKSVNGAFELTLNAISKDIEVDLSTANSYSDCAVIIQEAIRKVATNAKAKADNLEAFKNAVVLYSSLISGFIVKSGVSGSDSTITFIKSPTSGNDVSQSLGLSELEGAVLIDGYDLEGDLNNVFSTLQSVNGNYYVLSTVFKLDENQIENFAKFIDSSNDRFLGVVGSDDKRLISSENVLEKIAGYNGILVNYYKDDSAIGFCEGLISSMDFSQLNGNINLAFNDATKYIDLAITTKQELNFLEANKANAILKFGQMGQNQVWYGMGNIQGTKTNSANVYIGNSYIMFSLQFALANLFHNQAFIGLRGDFNNGLVVNAICDVFSKAVNANLVSVGAVLTESEKQIVISTFGEDSDKAIKQIENVGFYAKIGSPDLANSKLPVSTAYVANKGIKGLVINNYILGA